MVARSPRLPRPVLASVYSADTTDTPREANVRSPCFDDVGMSFSAQGDAEQISDRTSEAADVMTMRKRGAPSKGLRKSYTRSGRVSDTLPAPGQLLVSKALTASTPAAQSLRPSISALPPPPGPPPPPPAPWAKLEDEELPAEITRISAMERADSVESFGRFPLARQPDSDGRQSELRRLIDWGENLYRAVQKLEQEKLSLEKAFAVAQGELEQALQRCDEISGQVARGETHSTENAELRKQLAAYAVEIEVLRNEKAGHERSTREAQAVVQHLSVEREELIRSLQDIDWSHSEKSERVRQLEVQLDERNGLHNMVQEQLKVAMTELAHVGSSLKSAQEQRLSMPLTEDEEAIMEKDKLIDALVEIIHSFREQLETLQERCVQQTREFSDFSKKVRQRQLALQIQFDDYEQQLQGAGSSTPSKTIQARGYRNTRRLGQKLDAFPDVLDDLEDRQEELISVHFKCKQKMANAHDELQAQFAISRASRKTAEDKSCQLTQTLQRLNTQAQAKKDSRKDRTTSRYNSKILRPMVLACHEGAELVKVSEKSAKRERRHVWVDIDTMSLKWAKLPVRGNKAESFVDLSNVTHIGYGCMTRAHILFPESSPWLCFSLYTLQRSYDFECNTQLQAEAFVLSVSRLLTRLLKWPIPGSVPTRGHFLALAGWCKVEHACRKKNKSLLTALLDAVAAVSETAGIGMKRPPHFSAKREEMPLKKQNLSTKLGPAPPKRKLSLSFLSSRRAAN